MNSAQLATFWTTTLEAYNRWVDWTHVAQAMIRDTLPSHPTLELTLTEAQDLQHRRWIRLDERRTIIAALGLVVPDGPEFNELAAFLR